MNAIIRFCATMLVGLVFSATAQGEVKTRTITYSDGDTQLQGYLAWDSAVSGKRPGVLVVHEWWGLNDYVKRRAEMLAELGYAAFALDMYGDGKITEHADEAGKWAGQIQENIERWQRRALAGLDVLKKEDIVDKSRLAAIGYCFGGATVMQMAYSGADLKGVVSFHGSLPVPTDEQASRIKARILAAHGSADTFVPRERIQAFQDALNRANVDWEMVVYGNARHAFTNPDAAKHGIANLQYNRRADERSWRRMQIFFEDIF